MASWLDVRAHAGRWLVRIEDLDGPREVPGAAEAIVAALGAFGFRADAPVTYQSRREALYTETFDRLRQAGLIYPCGCTRREIEAAVPACATGGVAHVGVYPGTCRHGLPAGRVARAWRLRVPAGTTTLVDRAAGVLRQDVEREVGDFVVRRADGLWAYQLAVVVDDAEQGVTHVVRGVDLLDSTPRQRMLQDALGLPHPVTLHVPLVLDRSGAKLSKSDGAVALDPHDPLPALKCAAAHLDLAVEPSTTVPDFWERATTAWSARWRLP